MSGQVVDDGHMGNSWQEHSKGIIFKAVPRVKGVKGRVERARDSQHLESPLGEQDSREKFLQNDED